MAFPLFFAPAAMSQAEETEVLRLLVWPEYAPEMFCERFEDMIFDKYEKKIQLQISYTQGLEYFYEQIRLEKVDLVTLPHHLFKDQRFEYIGDRLLRPLHPEKIPRFKDILPKLRTLDSITRKGKVYGAPFCQGVYGLMYNADKIASPPTSLNILWDPEFKGDYIIGKNQFLHNICTTALALGYAHDSIEKYDQLNEPLFVGKLKDLCSNAAGFWSLYPEKDVAFSSKRLALGRGDNLLSLRSQGADWRFAEPEEGSTAWADCYAITRAVESGSFRLKLAREWINFVLSPEFQADHIIKTISRGAATSTAKDRLTGEQKAAYEKRLDYFNKKGVLLYPCTIRDRNGLQMLWDEAKQTEKTSP
jgi:spermidine/putrescine transport system substrate-binding protein